MKPIQRRFWLDKNKYSQARFIYTIDEFNQERQHKKGIISFLTIGAEYGSSVTYTFGGTELKLRAGWQKQLIKKIDIMINILEEAIKNFEEVKKFKIPCKRSKRVFLNPASSLHSGWIKYRVEYDKEYNTVSLALYLAGCFKTIILQVNIDIRFKKAFMQYEKNYESILNLLEKCKLYKEDLKKAMEKI